MRVCVCVCVKKFALIHSSERVFEFNCEQAQVENSNTLLKLYKHACPCL
jgi:hypothetical protein